MKLTKKTFKMGLTLEVVDKLELWSANEDLYTHTNTKVLGNGDTVTTIKLKNVNGSARMHVRVEGDKNLYQAFYIEAKMHTNIVDNGLRSKSKYVTEEDLFHSNKTSVLWE